jgi:hypothetical protein
VLRCAVLYRQVRLLEQMALNKVQEGDDDGARKVLQVGTGCVLDFFSMQGSSSCNAVTACGHRMMAQGHCLRIAHAGRSA